MAESFCQSLVKHFQQSLGTDKIKVEKVFEESPYLTTQQQQFATLKELGWSQIKVSLKPLSQKWNKKHLEITCDYQVLSG